MSPRTRASIALAAMLACVVPTIGCASGNHATMPVSTNAPEWIDRPNGLFDEGSSRVVYAVGIAADNPNPAARRNMAISRGRAELARTLQTVVQGLVKDYMSTNRDFYDMDTASSVEYYEDISRQVTDEVLVGSRQERAYRDPIDNTLYVLMRLDFDDVVSSYRAQMNAAFAREAVRKRIKAQADSFEGELDKQLEKLRGMEADAVAQLLGTE